MIFVVVCNTTLRFFVQSLKCSLQDFWTQIWHMVSLKEWLLYIIYIEYEHAVWFTLSVQLLFNLVWYPEASEKDVTHKHVTNPQLVSWSQLLVVPFTSMEWWQFTPAQDLPHDEHSQLCNVVCGHMSVCVSKKETSVKK